ncbi:MFS transporter [Bombilactobacillus thymidiniphilus]|uniref:MFS transporter n=1 Tax=Bombilactobacillus thymidiniphilus TaxID=2923363 RepID=A0ABY4PDC0_9LACO|nr:hypothetical protein [Bombilactobacillus thymidiniphilus]UQS83669.1 hypothetical protein MOO47_00255 [Bombilactobacillus thymidiniphilus]
MTIPQKLNHHSSILTVLNLKASWHNIQKVFKFPIVKILFPYACLLNLSFWLFYYLMPMYLNKQFKHYTFAYSLQELMIAIAAFICGLIMTKFSDYFLQHAYWYTIYLVLQAVGIVFMSLLFMIITNEFIKLMILIIAWLFYGIFNFLSSLIFITKVQQQVDNRHLGITFGIIFSIFSALGPISAALSGFIKQPNSQTVFGIGSLMLIVALVMLFDKRVAKLISFN